MLPIRSKLAYPQSLQTRSIATTLWCPQVLFGSDDLAQPGSVDLKRGRIVECHRGASWEETQERNPHAKRLEVGILVPGMIDVHTHVSALGRDWEGYRTATRAAVAGGITTIMGMPLNSLPPTTTLDAATMEHNAAVLTSLACDVGLWGGVIPDSMGDLELLLESPWIHGIKTFLSPLPPAAGYQAVSPKQLMDVARLCSEAQKPLLVHSELMREEEVTERLHCAFANHDHNIESYSAHLESRPPEWEQEAVKLVCKAAEQFHCHLHIVHLSDARGCLPFIERCKKHLDHSFDAKTGRRGRLTVETCPHYLMLDESLVASGETRVKCFPPIRDAGNRKLLWQGLSDGLIDLIASDHSPCEPEMRKMEEGGFQNAWGGLSGLQYQLQGTWTDAKNRGFNPEKLSTWWSHHPADMAGLASYKGRISEGFQADLCWWDPDFVGPPNSYSQEYHRWTGMTIFADNPDMRGRVLGTWVRGTKVYDGDRDEHIGAAGELLLACS